MTNKKDSADKGSSFSVKDRRPLDEQGKSRETDEIAETQKPPDTVKGESRTEQAAPADEATTEPLSIKVDFQTIVGLLSSPALVFLGMMDNPESGKKELNLALAEQHIELLDVLSQKTKGNLSKEEESILEQILCQLRMLYVQQSSAKKT